MITVRRDPRITSLLIHRAKGGYVDVQPLDQRLPPRRIDTVPAHAVKEPATELAQTPKGVVMPIVNRYRR